jgi:hypothetical protein
VGSPAGLGLDVLLKARGWNRQGGGDAGSE